MKEKIISADENGVLLDHWNHKELKTLVENFINNASDNIENKDVILKSCMFSLVSCLIDSGHVKVGMSSSLEFINDNLGSWELSISKKA